MLAKKKKNRARSWGVEPQPPALVLGGEAAPVQALEVTAVFMRQVGKKEEAV